MFSAARCFVPLHPQPYAGSVPCRRARPPTAVSAALRRRGTRGRSRGSSWDDGSDDSDSDDRIDAGFFGQEQDDEEEPPHPRGRPHRSRNCGVPTCCARCRGRRAAKEAKKKKDKKPAARQRQGREKLKGGGEVAVAGEVRTVVVKPEWAARIRELELRVQQLADRYHQ